MKRLTLFLMLPLGAALVAACNVPFAANLPVGPQAWVDAPLTGTTISLAPLDIVSHASDNGGVAQFELSINGAVLRTDPSPDTKSALVTMHQTWQPPSPGTYLLTVRGQNEAGAWSGPASVTVYVQAPAQTAAAASTSTAQPSATASPQPPAASTGAVSIERVSTNSVYLGAATCGPLEVTITAHATAPNPVTVVVLFYRFSSGDFQSEAMNAIGGDLYQLTLNPTSLLGSSSGFDQGTLQYQVVVQQNGGDTSLRTPVLSDISVQACGSPAPPAACSSYTDKRSCQANGCSWVSKPGIVPIFACQNP